MQKERLLSLDVFRGFAIAGMIIVNSPGYPITYPWLEHSTWNGCTFADLVFPFFLYILGISTYLSVNKTPLKGTNWVLKVTRRAGILFAIGLFLNAFPNHFEWHTLRIYGVLQRIAICYFVCAMICATTDAKKQVILFFLILAGYGLLFQDADITAENNLSAAIDRALFSASHLYGKTFDPEGLLSTLPAIATTLMGCLTGAFLQTKSQKIVHFYCLFLGAIVCLFLGFIGSFWFPINKTLWSSTYVLWTGGWSLLIFALFYFFNDIKGFTAWSKCFEILGVNALTAYILHIFFLKLQVYIHVNTTQNIKSFLTHFLFGWASPENASFLYAFSYLIVWLFLLGILYKKKIYIKL